MARRLILALIAASVLAATAGATIVGQPARDAAREHDLLDLRWERIGNPLRERVQLLVPRRHRWRNLPSVPRLRGRGTRDLLRLRLRVHRLLGLLGLLLVP